MNDTKKKRERRDKKKLSHTVNTLASIIDTIATSMKGDIDGGEEWQDNNNQDGIRATEIVVNLLADGEAIETVTLNNDNYWTYTWRDRKSVV